MTRQVAKDGRWFVGSCDVDSGQIYVVDPCYIKHHKSLHADENWEEFCTQRFPDGQQQPAKEMCSGVVSSTYFGDGSYPVYVTIQDGAPKKMEIIFTRNTTQRDEDKEMQYEDLEK